MLIVHPPMIIGKLKDPSIANDHLSFFFFYLLPFLIFYLYFVFFFSLELSSTYNYSYSRLVEMQFNRLINRSMTS